MHVCASEGGQCVEGRNVQSQSPGTRALQMTDMNELGGGGGLHYCEGLWELCHSLYNLEEVIFPLLICRIRGLIHVRGPQSGDLEPCYANLWSPGASAPWGWEWVGGRLLDVQTLRPHPDSCVLLSIVMASPGDTHTLKFEKHCLRDSC